MPPTVAAAASPASTTFRRQRTEASVENGVSLIDCLQRSVVETFIWQLARMKSRLCPNSLSLRPRDAQKSADKVHRAFASGCVDHLALLASLARALKQAENINLVHPWIHDSLRRWIRVLHAALFSTVDTRSCVSLRRLCCISRISP